MASGSFESLEMEFWSDWEEGVDIPSPLRIVKRPSTSTDTVDTGTPSPPRVSKRPVNPTRSDAAIPSPLRITKRPNNITNTDARTNSREVIDIPRRSSSIYNYISSSPPDSDSGCLTIHKQRKQKSVAPHESIYNPSRTKKGHVAREVPGGVKVEEEVKGQDPKLIQEAGACICFR
ncbi:hypothetical protein V490_01072 [Pseudogymnoascus sp. VKM F-3557]|nr:hypothetical protein V490_01072 [Pseudogymnoascus sp. VKM F-3557]